MQYRKSQYPKSTIVLGLAVALGATTWGARVLSADAPAFKRVPLQKQDLSTPNHEAVQVRGEFSPGAATPKHTHPGEELSYVLEGQVSVEIDGKPAMTLKAGDVFFIPAGQAHLAKNTGTTPTKVLSTYIVEKGKPLTTPVPPPASGSAPAPAPKK